MFIFQILVIKVVGKLPEGIRVSLRESWFIFFVFMVAFIVVLLVVMLLFAHFFVGWDLPLVSVKHASTAEHWGQLGDFFGGILNPVLSFLALMAVLYSINIQRLELKETRKEIKESNYIQNSQTEIYRQQSMESSLMALLQMHSQVRDQLQNREKSGRLAISQVIEEFDSYVDLAILLDDLDSESARDTIKSFVSRFMLARQVRFGHYFKSMYQILKFIDGYNNSFSDFSQGDNFGDERYVRTYRRFKYDYSLRRQYVNFLKAQLSTDELKFLLLNSLTTNGEGMRYYVEQYSMLKGLKLKWFIVGRASSDKMIDELAFQDYEDIPIPKLIEREKRHRRAGLRRALKRKLSTAITEE